MVAAYSHPRRDGSDQLTKLIGLVESLVEIANSTNNRCNILSEQINSLVDRIERLEAAQRAASGAVSRWI